MDRYKIAAIGASVGGVRALRDFFSQIHPPSNLAFVIVTHLPHEVSASLGIMLSEITPFAVHILQHDTAPAADHIYMLPEHLRLTIRQGILMVRERAEGDDRCHTIDEFLFSLAEDQKENAIAVILSGIGRDGADGAHMIGACGGLVLTQDPQTAQFSSMPQATIDAHGPQKILSPLKLAKSLVEYLAETSRPVPTLSATSPSGRPSTFTSVADVMPFCPE